MSKSVAVQLLEKSALCTLNRPEKRNPISASMRTDLRSALESLRLTESVRCVIITGAGNAFCSGLDLEGLAEQTRLTPAEHTADSQSIADFFEYVRTYPKPTIAAVNGPAVAGGCCLALLCDFTLASADAFFSFSEVKIGFVPALAGVYLERMAGAKVARDLLMTGRRVPADEAQRLGLITVVVPSTELLARAMKLADTLAQNGPTAVKLTKDLLSRAAGRNLYDALQLAVEVNAMARDTSECKEGVDAFLLKRPAPWIVQSRTPEAATIHAAQSKRSGKTKPKG